MSGSPVVVFDNADGQLMQVLTNVISIWTLFAAAFGFDSAQLQTAFCHKFQH